MPDVGLRNLEFFSRVVSTGEAVVVPVYRRAFVTPSIVRQPAKPCKWGGKGKYQITLPLMDYTCPKIKRIAGADVREAGEGIEERNSWQDDGGAPLAFAP